jgi:hypothetical protein
VQQVISFVVTRKLAFYHDAARLPSKDFDIVDIQVFPSEALLFEDVLLVVVTSKLLTTIF